jgi:hypothetical protein
MGIDIKEPPSAHPYTEFFFENVTSHQQIDPGLVQGIIKCVHESGMRTTDEDVLNHISGDAVIVYRDDQTGDVFAFSSTSFTSPNEHMGTTEISDEQGCYLVGATVAKSRQSEGVYKRMNERRIGLGLERGLSLVFTQTQNLRVLNGVQSVLDMYVEQGLITGYEFERVLNPGCYGRMLTEDMPLPFPELDYSKGDAYLLLFHLQGVKPK